MPMPTNTPAFPSFLFRHAFQWGAWQGIDSPITYAAWFVAQGFTSDDDLMVSHSDRYPDFVRDMQGGLRLAVVTSATPLETVQRYLPSNYQATANESVIVIHGRDSAGWGLDTYVLPRLASGSHYAREVTVEPDAENAEDIAWFLTHR